jgi:hypothetical protein
MGTRPLTVAIVALLAFSGANAMNGKAAAVVSLLTGSSPTSRLILATVTDNSLVSDTVVKGEPGKGFYYPTFNLDGTRIAFYKNGAGVCVYDLASRSVRTVAKTLDASGNSAFLAWPGADGGKWVYYHRPCRGCRNGCSGEIWKVNVDDTTRNILVCDYAKNDTAEWVNRWSLSADGKYSVVAHGVLPGDIKQFGSAYGSMAIAFTFPPQLDPASGTANPTLTAVQNCCMFAWECNQGLTASGKFLFHFSGAHNAVYGENWNHTTNTEARRPDPYFRSFNPGLESWLAAGPAPGPGRGEESLHWPRGGSNSDRIFTVLYGTNYQTQVTAGDNLAVINWKTGQAVAATNNPLSPFWFAEPGDFHLDGGPANSYQEEDGAWVVIPLPTQIGRDRDRPGVFGGIPARTLTIYNLRGARAGILDASALTRNRRIGVERGMYIVSGRGTTEKAVMLDNGVSGR